MTVTTTITTSNDSNTKTPTTTTTTTTTTTPPAQPPQRPSVRWQPLPAWWPNRLSNPKCKNHGWTVPGLIACLFLQVDMQTRNCLNVDVFSPYRESRSSCLLFIFQLNTQVGIIIFLLFFFRGELSERAVWSVLWRARRMVSQPVTQTSKQSVSHPVSQPVIHQLPNQPVNQ